MTGNAPNPLAGLGPDDYLSVSQKLLPPGRAWTRNPNSWLTKVLTAISQTFGRLHQSISNLTEVESDPRQTIALLPDWERSFGLPDPCSPPDASYQQRRAALLARISSQGGQSPDYYIAVAAALGYEITITEFQASTFGTAVFGDPFYDYTWEDAWQVNAPEITATYAAFGEAVFGDPWASYSDTQLGCVLNRLKPAHTTLLLATD